MKKLLLILLLVLSSNVYARLGIKYRVNSLENNMKNIFQLNNSLNYLYDNKQNVGFTQYTTVPTVNALGDNEMVHYVSGSNYRLYTKINDTIMYTPFSTNNIFLTTSTYAQNADTVDGYHMNQNVLTTSTPTFGGALISGNVGIGTTNPLWKLDVVSAADGARFSANTPGVPGVGYSDTIYGSGGTSSGNNTYLCLGRTAATSGVGFIQAFIANGSYNNGNISLNPSGGNVGIGTTNPDVALDVNGYTQLGSDAPKIKCIKLSTMTASVEGGNTGVAHGVTNSKIISITVMVEYSAGLYVCNGWQFNAGYQFDWATSGANVLVYLHPTNSEGILNKPVKILITYEE